MSDNVYMQNAASVSRLMAEVASLKTSLAQVEESLQEAMDCIQPQTFGGGGGEEGGKIRLRGNAYDSSDTSDDLVYLEPPQTSGGAFSTDQSNVIVRTRHVGGSSSSGYGTVEIGVYYT